MAQGSRDAGRAATLARKRAVEGKQAMARAVETWRETVHGLPSVVGAPLRRPMVAAAPRRAGWERRTA